MLTSVTTWMLFIDSLKVSFRVSFQFSNFIQIKQLIVTVNAFYSCATVSRILRNFWKKWKEKIKLRKSNNERWRRLYTSWFPWQYMFIIYHGQTYHYPFLFCCLIPEYVINTELDRFYPNERNIIITIYNMFTIFNWWRKKAKISISVRWL